MSKVTAAFPAEIALRVLPAISDEETRYYLNGLSIEPAPSGGCFIVATNGHIMAAEHSETAHLAGDSFIARFAKDAVKHLRAAKRDSWPRWVVVTREETGKARGAIVFATDAKEAIDAAAAGSPAVVLTQWLGADIDGSFPDWRAVLPKPEDMKSGACFDSANPALIDRIARGAPAIRIWHNSDSGSPHLITRPDATAWLGVFMPMRGKSELPAWFKPEPAAAAESEAAA